MEKEPIEDGLTWNHEHNDAVFKSHEHFKKEISRLCYGDLYVIGRIWIQALRKVLVGADFSLIPVVHAAKSTDLIWRPPPKPPKMKYKDLPIYESPHYDYKNYLEDQKKCPKANVKILQTYLYPKVKSYRQYWSKSIKEFNKDARELKDDGMKVARKKKDEMLRYLRSDDNILLRQALLATGVGTGYFVGRSAGVLKRLLCTAAGGLATGAVVFPIETDKEFRNFCCLIDYTAVNLFNMISGMNYQLRRGCPPELPPKPPARTADKRNLMCEPDKTAQGKAAPAKAAPAKAAPAKAAPAKAAPAKAAAKK